MRQKRNGAMEQKYSSLKLKFKEKCLSLKGPKRFVFFYSFYRTGEKITSFSEEFIFEYQTYLW